MATSVLPQPWNDPKRPDPSDYSLNPYVKARSNELVTLFTDTGNDSSMQISASKKLKQYHGVRYKNMGRESDKKLLRLKQAEEYTKYTERSKFFSNYDDGEASNKRNVESMAMTNPRFILDKANDAELEAKINNVNAIGKRLMVDEGTGEFDFSAPDADQVGIVRDSNQSFVSRRDMYFIKPQPVGDQKTGGEPLQKTKDLLEHFTKVQMDLLAKKNSQRNSKFKSTRRRR